MTMTNKDTGLLRNLVSSADGTYTAAALPPGIYQVKTGMTGFRTVLREAVVETGSITTVDVHLELGQTEEVVNVEAATAQIEYASHSINSCLAG